MQISRFWMNSKSNEVATSGTKGVEVDAVDAADVVVVDMAVVVVVEIEDTVEEVVTIETVVAEVAAVDIDANLDIPVMINGKKKLMFFQIFQGILQSGNPFTNTILFATDIGVPTATIVTEAEVEGVVAMTDTMTAGKLL